MTINNGTYLITVAEEMATTVTEASFHKTRYNANKFLHDASYGLLDDDHFKMYYGIIIPATYIPNGIKGCTPWIIIKNPERYTDITAEDDIFIRKGPARLANLPDIIQGILKENDYFPKDVTIKDVFLLFGKNITPVFHITDENEDEEFTDRLDKINDAITKFTERGSDESKSKSANS